MATYVDNSTGKIFDMSEKSFEKLMARMKLPNGKPKFERFNGKKKEVTKVSLPQPEPTKAEQLAAVLNEELQAMTARQLVEAIKEISEVPQLQALAQDSRKTVSAAAQARLAEGATKGGEA